MTAILAEDAAMRLPGWPPNFAALYEALTGDFRGDVPMYLEMAKRHNGPILEMACGTGRVAIPLVEAGHSVVGIDFDAGMIKLAGSKAKLLGLHRNISFIQANMLDFDLGRKFPLVVAGGNSLIHLLDFRLVLKAIERCREHLEDDGSFFVAFETSPYMAAAGKYRVERERPRQVFNRGTGQTLLYRGTITVDPNFQRIIRHHEFANPRAPHDPNKTAIFDYATRPIYPGELELMLDICGLKVVEIFGDYDLRPLTRQSEKLIMRAVKK